MAFIIKEGTTGGEGTTDAEKSAIIKWLGDTGTIVRTKEQDQSAIQAAINEANSKRKIDSVLKEVTGIEKGASESEEDYAKRAVTEKLKELTGLQTKLKELELKGLDGSELAKEYKERLEVVSKNFEKYKTEKEVEITTAKKASFDLKVESEINGVISKFLPSLKKLHDDPKINQDLINTVVDAHKAKFRNEIQVTEHEGVLVFKDKAGTTLRKDVDGTFKALEEVLKPYFDPIIDNNYKASGAGSGPGAGGAGNGEQKKDANGKVITDWSAKFKIPETVKSQIQLTAYLKDQKLEYGTKDFDEAFMQLNKNAEGKPLPVTAQ